MTTVAPFDNVSSVEYFGLGIFDAVPVLVEADGVDTSNIVGPFSATKLEWFYTDGSVTYDGTSRCSVPWSWPLRLLTICA